MIIAHLGVIIEQNMNFINISYKQKNHSKTIENNHRNTNHHTLHTISIKLHFLLMAARRFV